MAKEALAFSRTPTPKDPTLKREKQRSPAKKKESGKRKTTPSKGLNLNSSNLSSCSGGPGFDQKSNERLSSEKVY